MIRGLGPKNRNRPSKHRSATVPAPRPGPRPPAPVVLGSTRASRSRLTPPSPFSPRANRPISRRSDSVFHSDVCSMKPQYRALVLGLTYEWATSKDLWPLKGCHNDARSFAQLLRERYGWEDVTLMTDEEKNRNTPLWPTRKNMLKKIGELVADARAGDMFVIYYAGHSGQVSAVQDTNETDGMDEHMISVDGKKILDDMLRKILVQSLCNGTRLTAIFDSCHSGTLLDLRLYPTQSRKSERGQEREIPVFESKSKTRANSLPTPTPEPYGQKEEMRKRKKRWIALGALARLYSLSMRNTKLTASGLVRKNIPAITIDAVASTNDRSTAVALEDGSAVSDVSSVLTDAPSAQSHEPLAQAEGRPDLETNLNPHRVCAHCRMLSRDKPIVNSISACMDGQLAAEDSRKETGIMTPALVHLLNREPDLSSVEIRRRLNPKVFDACCGFILDKLKKAGAKKRAKAKWQQSFAQFVASMSWQVLQLGSEEDEHMKEPLLLCAPSMSSKG